MNIGGKKKQIKTNKTKTMNKVWTKLMETSDYKEKTYKTKKQQRTEGGK